MSYDSWLGAYSRAEVDVECGVCGSRFAAVVEREFGTSWVTPEECRGCGATVDEEWISEPEPPEPTLERDR